MATAASSKPDERPILGMGVGRMAALATVAASVLPLVVLHRFADARIAAWAASQAGPAEMGVWRVIARGGQPLTWFIAATVGFGIAAAFNWANTARWMGMLAFSVLWAGLADIAVMGSPRGAATAGAVATVLSLWAPRWCPAWVGCAALLSVAQLVVRGTSATQIALGAILGALGVLLVEYAWHHAAPEYPPRRGAKLRS